MVARDRLLQGVRFEPLEGKPQWRGRKQRLFMHLERSLKEYDTAAASQNKKA